MIEERKKNNVRTKRQKISVTIRYAGFEAVLCSFPLFLLEKERFQGFLEVLKLR
jgi:hypothetical protein